MELIVRSIVDMSMAAGVQAILHERSIGPWVGGFIHLSTIEGIIAKEHPTVFGAFIDGELGGVGVVEGRGKKFMLKLNYTSVLPPYRRKGVARALDIARILQAVVEGRRLIEVVVMEDNLPRLKSLEKVGFQHSGTFPHYTATGKNLHYLHLSLMDVRNLEAVGNLLPPDTSIFLRESSATTDDYNYNLGSYRKKIPELAEKIEQFRAWLDGEDYIVVEKAVKERGGFFDA